MALILYSSNRASNAIRSSKRACIAKCNTFPEWDVSGSVKGFYPGCKGPHCGACGGRQDGGERMVQGAHLCSPRAVARADTKKGPSVRQGLAHLICTQEVQKSNVRRLLEAQKKRRRKQMAKSSKETGSTGEGARRNLPWMNADEKGRGSQDVNRSRSA